MGQEKGTPALRRRRTGQFAGAANLTERQNQFCRYYLANGGNATDAARVAGYATPEADGWKLKGNPRIVAAIQRHNLREVQTRLAGLALGTLRDVMLDPNAPAPARVKAATYLVDLSGLKDSGNKTLGDKSLSEYTAEELEQIIKDGLEKRDAETKTINATPESVTETDI